MKTAMNLLARRYVTALEAGGVDVKLAISEMVEFTRRQKENERLLVERYAD